VTDATHITATSPAGAVGTVDVTVTTSGGPSAVNSGDHFIYFKIHGYNILTAPGGIYSFGDATYWGNLIDHGYPGPAVGLSETPAGDGYAILTGPGNLYTFGTAGYYGNLTDHHYPGPAVALDYTPNPGTINSPTGHGYAILTASGAIYTFGDAGYYGNLIDHGYPGRAVSFAWSASGHGYWILTDSGNLYSFGDAGYYGNLNDPCAGAASCPYASFPGHPAGLTRSAGGSGYLILTAEGGIYTFGDASGQYYGNLIDHGYPTPGVAFSTTP
jgi:hypothetical protein